MSTVTIGGYPIQSIRGDGQVTATAYAGAVRSVTAGTTLTGADSLLVVTSGSTQTVNLPVPATVPVGRWFTVVNRGTAAVTLGSSPAGPTINGSATYSIAAGASVVVQTDGSNWLIASRSLAVGTAAGTVAAGDDGRLSDQRTPLDGSVTTAKLDAALASSLAQEMAADLELPTYPDGSTTATLVPRPVHADVRDHDAVGDGLTDDTAAVTAALAAAGSGGVAVIPAGFTIRLASSVTIPAGVTLQNHGTISLGSGAVIEVANVRASLTGGTVTASAGGASYMARIGRDGATIERVRFTGTNRTAAVRVSYEANTSSPGTIVGGAIRDCVFSGTAYAILKQHSATITRGFHVTGNRFENITGGDGIEWNVGADDRELLISDNILAGIARGAVANAGIAIGIAGGSYGGDPDEQTRQFAVTGNVIVGAHEGVHVEACNRFSVVGNHIAEMTSTAELTGSGVQVYGSTEFTIRGNTIIDSNRGVAVQYGGPAFAQSSDYVIAGNDAIGCATGIRAWCEGIGKTGKVLGNTATGCTVGFEIRGIGNWTVEGNTSTGCGSHTLNFTLLNSGLGSVVPVTLALADNVFHDAVNNATVTVTGVSNFSTVRDTGNSFSLGRALGSDGRVLHASAAPTSTELRVGDVVLNTAAATAGAPLGWLCTTAGSQQKIGSTHNFTATSGNDYVVCVSPGNPALAFDVGQRIVLAGAGAAGAALTTTIRRLYSESSEFRIGITDTVSTTVGSGTAITLPSTSVLVPFYPGSTDSQPGSDGWLKLHAGGNLDALITGTITRDSNGAPTSASVTWPDGTSGTYTATTVSTAFPGAVDAYTVTYAGSPTKTVTQSAVTRDSTSGAVTTRPAMTVA